MLAPPANYDNCQPLSDELQVSWTVDQTEERVFFRLCGCVDAGDYMAFGLSGSDSAVEMVGADAVITWHDSEGTGAVDYYLSARAQVRDAIPCKINTYIYTYIMHSSYMQSCMCVVHCGINFVNQSTRRHCMLLPAVSAKHSNRAKRSMPR